MPRPKKADKNKRRVEALHDLQQDHEQFLLAFEKPTQIYRFLRARQILSPTFMHRNLLYLKERCSRTNARRSKFAIKDLLSVALSKESPLELTDDDKNEDLQIALKGLAMDPSKQDSRFLHTKKFKRVEVEVLLSRTILNKRKDVDFSAKETSYGVMDIPVNPKLNSENARSHNVKESVINIPASDLSNTSEDGSIKSYTIVFRVREVSSDDDESDESDSEDSREDSEEEQDGETVRPKKKKKKATDDDEDDNDDDRASISLKNLTTGPRKRKSRNVGLRNENKKKENNECNTRSKDVNNVDSAKSDMKQKVHYFRNSKPPLLKRNANTSKEVLFDAELLIFNSDFECQVPGGDYELLIVRKEEEKRKEYKRKAVWESFDGGKEVKVYGSFSAPTLKLNLNWYSSEDDSSPLFGNDQIIEDTSGRRTRTAVMSINRHLSNKDEERNGVFVMAADAVQYKKIRLKTEAQRSNGFANGSDNASAQCPVFYQFMYNNNTQQQTESRDDFYCPWCQLNCMALYGLMKHLKLCHPRFLFRYSQQSKGTNVIVTVNECYDGSYAGNPQNIFCQPGMAFSRRGPVRRIPVTDILVYKPERKPMDKTCNLAELLEKEDVEALEPSQLSTGHRRLYFHSLTSLPIRPCEFDIDSEQESTEPDWLFGHTKRMIDEFTDVNEGEKALMKIWNLHIMRNNSISDSQLEDQCKVFIDTNIALLSKHSLRGNMLLHFVCLVDFGIFKTSSVITLMDYYDEAVKNHKKTAPTTNPTDHRHELMSPDFPEPDLLPRIKQLQELISAADSAS